MNKGERDEILMKIILSYIRDNGSIFNGSIFKINGKKINSVGFDSKEYPIIPVNIYNNLRIMSNDKLKNEADKLGIFKAKRFDKSDVYINGEGYSLKSFSGSPPAIINHTTRPGFEKACDYYGIDIKPLDDMIDNYWSLRLKGVIKEDIKNKDINSPFKNNKKYLKPILEYFLFIGSKQKISEHPADYIMDYENPFNPNTWHVYNSTNIVNLIWNKLIFSLRSKKGMPKDYENKNKDNYKPYSSIDKWVRFYDGDYRGALHIRVSKK